MSYVIQKYSAYDPKKWGIPWAAPVNAEGLPDFKSPHKAHFSGSKGSGGDLFVVDPLPESVWVYGQREYRSPRSEMHYVVFKKSLLERKFIPIEPEDLVKKLNAFEKSKKKKKTAAEDGADPEPEGEEPAGEEPEAVEPAEKKPEKPAEKKRIVHSISLSLREEEQVRQRAAAVGMEIGPFIKAEALRGRVRGYQLQAVTEHSQRIGAIAADIHRLIHAPHPDRWLYEADLQEIRQLQEALLQAETEILKELRKGLR